MRVTRKGGQIMNYLRPAIIGLLALAALVFVSGRDQATASSFSPSSTYGISDSTPGASADITLTFDIPEPDANVDVLMFFTAPQWDVAQDSNVPDGAIVAELSSQVTMGIINGACRNILPIGFIMADATTDGRTTIPFDDPDSDTTGDLDDQFDVGPDGLALGVTRLPEYLTRIFSGLTPISRAYAQTVVAGVFVSLNIVTFEPGTPFQTTAGPVATDPILGYPSVVILQDHGDPQAPPHPSAITDLCSPIQTSNITFGASKDNACTDTAPVDALCGVTGALIADGAGTNPDESGFPVRTNPDAGTYNSVVYAVSQRDADDDGIENGLDTCPFDPNVGDPRISGDGDFDNDGLDAACDPNDDPRAGGTNSDEDLDGVLNRADNCPLVPNGRFVEDNQKDTDNDGIGDACDPSPDAPDGHNHAVCLVSTVDVGGGGTPPESPENLQPCDPDAPVDSDGDVNCDSLVNVVDALFVLQFEVGLRVDSGGCPLPSPPPDTLNVAVCDVTGDTDCNVVDALFILQCEVGIPNVLCPA